MIFLCHSTAALFFFLWNSASSLGQENACNPTAGGKAALPTSLSESFGDDDLRDGQQRQRAATASAAYYLPFSSCASHIHLLRILSWEEGQPFGSYSTMWSHKVTTYPFFVGLVTMVYICTLRPKGLL